VDLIAPLACSTSPAKGVNQNQTMRALLSRSGAAKLSAIMPAISVLPEPVGASSSRQPLKAVAAARLASSPAWRNWLSA
jgi:hypothetical protein